MECDAAELTRARKFLLINPGPNGRYTMDNAKPFNEIINDPEIAKEASKLNMTQLDYIARIKACIHAARAAAAGHGGQMRRHGRRNTRGKCSGGKRSGGKRSSGKRSRRTCRR